MKTTDMVMVVKESLMSNPALHSKALAEKLGISMCDLTKIYSAIRGKIPHVARRPLSHEEFALSVLQEDILSEQGITWLQRLKDNQPIYPQYMDLHLGLTCPADCCFCYSNGCQHGGTYQNRDTTFTEEPITSMLTQFAAKGGERVFPSGGLEPFVSPFVQHTIVKAAELQLQLYCYTNGLPSVWDKPELLDTIVKYVTNMRFSVHAATSQTFAAVELPSAKPANVKTLFEKVIGRVRALVATRKSDNSKLQIEVIMVVIDQNIAEVEAAIALWQNIGVDIVFLHRDTVDGSQVWLSPENQKKYSELLCKIRQESEAGTYFPMRISGDRHVNGLGKHEGACYLPFKHPAVDAYGNVWSCCSQANPGAQSPKCLLGNVIDTSWGNIFKRLTESQSYQNFGCTHCDTNFAPVFNRLVKKVLQDWKDGIYPRNQPF
jgi:organic radical activating enzyme